MTPEWSLMTHRPRLALVLAGIATSLAMAGCARLATKAPPGVDLSGRWALNEALSDDPQAVMDAQRERMRQRAGRAGPMGGGPMSGGPMGRGGPMGGGRSGHGGVPGGGGPSGNRPGAMGGGAMSQRMQLPMAAKQMDIQQSAQDLLIESENVSTRYVYGQKSAVSIPRGTADRQAGWKGKTFVVETKAPEGPSTVQRYALNPEGQLIVTTEVSGRGPSLKLQQVYEHRPQDHS